MSDPLARLTTVNEEARAFARMRGRAMANLLRQALATSRLRVMLVAVLSGVFWGGLFWLFLEAFHFLNAALAHAPTRDQAIRAVFSIFFASLLVMLWFSSAIILYSSIYRSREVQFLLTTPARAERVYLHKFQETVLFSSWGFLLLGSPMLVAYGMAVEAPWYYYLLLLPFLVAFVIIPAGLGAVSCVVVMWKLPSVRLHAVGLVSVALAALTLGVGWSVLSGGDADLLTPGWFDELLGRLRFSEHRLFPNWWLSTGLLETARGEWSEGVKFLALITANALLVHVAAVSVAGRLLRRGYFALQAAGQPRRPLRGAWIDAALTRCLFFLTPSTRLLIVKDARLFRRDPMQWSQFLIFLGLLGLYFVNVRRFRYDVHQATWVNMISFLNLAVVGLILSTFTSRFIFPMISLEGRRFWILGLLPLRRETILWSKFLFAASGTTLVSTLLVALSDLMLRVLPLVLAVHLLAAVVLCLGLSGIAVGMGALLPNLREESPSKIAAGFGGTLNLVVSALYIVAVVVLTAVPCHLYVAADQGHARPAWAQHAGSGTWLAVGIVASLALGAAATFWPMRAGARAFSRLEF